ncbi:MAG: hypothetical protein KJ058_10245 [Thermoanaerobaculia bacterium]|nr:hypothetical protein [Thermoanaerobaculia bacterium]
MRRTLTLILLAALVPLATAPVLAQVRLPELDAATTPLGDDDLFLVRQDGETRDEKVTWSALRSSLQDALTLVLGPASACVDNQLARWNGASNTALQCSPLVVADTTGDITAPGALTIATGAGGDLILDPDTTGAVVIPTGNSVKLFGLGSGATDSEYLAITATAGAGFTLAPVTNGTGGDNLSIILDAAGTGTVQAPGQGTYADDHVQIGPGAVANSNADNQGSVAIGRSASAGSGSVSQSTAVGSAATAAGQNAAAYGVSSSATGGNSVAIGPLASSAGNQSIAIGLNASSGHGNSVAVSAGVTTAANQFLFGNSTKLYLGQVTNASPAGYVAEINATGGSGTDIAGASLTLAGGKGTGNAAGGSVVIQTSDPGASGTTLQTLATRVTVGVERTTIANILSLTGIAAAPGSPAAGDIVYDSVNNLFCGYTGSAWVSFSGAGTCWAE